MITPLRASDELDIAGLERLIAHLLAGGVHGIFILGTTGEAPGLSYRLRRELIRRVCGLVGQRVPVLVGITDPSITEARQLCNEASDAGASAVVAAPPFYFPNSQPELLAYFIRLAASLPLPLFLYQMPTHTKTLISMDGMRRLLDEPNVIGIKDSSGNMADYHRLVEIVRGREGVSLLIGPEELLAESLLFGGHGGVCGGANLFPRLYVDLYEAATAGRLERTVELHRRVIKISSTLYGVGRFGSAFIKGLKGSLGLLGICDDFVAEPFSRFAPPERERLRGLLGDLGAL